MSDKIELIKKEPSDYDKKLLVIGVFHGDEKQGKYFINSYLKQYPESGKNAIYYIPELNKNNKRTNKNNVDLNRNFPTKNWTKSTKNEYWGGNKPNSEIETKFLVDLIEKNHFNAIITIHAPYKVINYDGPSEILAQKISSILNYPPKADIGYPTPGSFGTYCGLERNIPTITIEIDENEDLEALNKKFYTLFNYLKNDY